MIRVYKLQSVIEWITSDFAIFEYFFEAFWVAGWPLYGAEKYFFLLVFIWNKLANTRTYNIKKNEYGKFLSIVGFLYHVNRFFTALFTQVR